MTNRERIGLILKRKKADRIGLMEHFWGDTHKAYVDGGHIQPNEDFAEHFNLDFMMAGWPNYVADLDYTPETIAEDEDTITTKNGNGAILRTHKKHDTTPEHVAFTVTEREGWENIRPLLANWDERRIDVDAYKAGRAKAAEQGRFFCWSGVNVFEQMHPICGHEHMLVGMLDDPDWIHDMCDVLSTLNIRAMEELFSKGGVPDGVWFYEDMGYKQSPFMSPALYDELIKPYHKRTIDFIKSYGIPTIMHSCGFVEPLLPGMIEAGIDCLQVIEIKAGMDLLRIFKNYGDVLSLCGGIDVRVLYTNDKAQIDAELEAKIPIVKEGYGYILHSDHSIPKTVNYETFQYFIEKGLALGKYES